MFSLLKHGFLMPNQFFTNPIRCLATKLKINKQQKQVVETFLSELGLSQTEVAHIIQRYAMIQTKTPQTMRLKVNFLKEMGMNQYQIIRTIKFCPSFLGRSITALRPKLIFLTIECRLSNVALCRAFCSAPTLFALNTQTLVQRFRFLEELIGSGEMPRFLERYPAVLLVNPETRWQVYLEIFKNRLGMTQAEIGRIVRLCPRTVGSNYNSTLIPKIDAFETFFQKRTGSKEEGKEMAKVAILKNPSLLGLSLKDRLMPRLEVLARLQLSFSRTWFTLTDEAFKMKIEELESKMENES